MLNKSWGFIDFCLLIFLNEKVSQAPTSPKGLTELGRKGVILILICQPTFKIEAN